MAYIKPDSNSNQRYVNGIRLKKYLFQFMTTLKNLKILKKSILISLKFGICGKKIQIRKNVINLEKTVENPQIAEEVSSSLHTFSEILPMDVSRNQSFRLLSFGSTR